MLRRVSSSLARRHSTAAAPLVNGVNRHVVAALIANHATTVAEITNLICARGYNVDSLVVGRTDIPGLVRLSVVVHGTDHHVTMMKRQLDDVVQVAAVKILTSNSQSQPNDSITLVERDLLLAKVSLSVPDARAAIATMAAQHGATVLHTSTTHAMVQLADAPTRIDAFLTQLEPLGLAEVHRSGVLAMDTDAAVTDRAVHVAFDRHHPGDMDSVDSTMLPPG
ncbi:Aste57867_9513 [Aphanomyces stellatus]|uniref:Aste57867_9513 protein n=1 Tax=Aphanomyces stellatus TaxID=120398 RepID=A0A485KN65_9STRA|nr:hypothetical protein As57867_009476 [Aphanomyces stellatus]VFT86392.1 Aste57867_9513 [Aphanomyces stellatus]